MIKRTAEFTMTIIGASLSAFGALIMGIFSLFLFAGTMFSDDATSEDIAGLAIGGGLFFYFFILAAVATVLGFIAAFKLKNNKQVKGWSITLIVFGGLCLFSYGGWITAVLFLISGIMSLVKMANEPKPDEDFFD